MDVIDRSHAPSSCFRRSNLKKTEAVAVTCSSLRHSLSPTLFITTLFPTASFYRRAEKAINRHAVSTAYSPSTPPVGSSLTLPAVRARACRTKRYCKNG
jgi:hypothetical protein